MKALGSKGVNAEEFLVKDEVFLCTLLEVDEPTSFKEAIDSPNHKEWMDAMKDEIDSMARNKV